MKSATLSIVCMALSCSIIAQPTITAFSPALASIGMTVTITGTNFTGATQVSLGGTAASSFSVVSATQITAVVAGGTTDVVRVTTAAGSGTRTGFHYVTMSGVITDFGGYWFSSMTSTSAIFPDSSHNLLAFTYNGITYSTGVNNGLLTGKGINYAAGSYKALPIAGISGTNSGGAVYLALSRKVDGSALVANTPAVANYSIRSVLVDGQNGLDLGTGVTNLPASANLTFTIYNINTLILSNSEPDIIITQIADPNALATPSYDIYSFIDASGSVVGNVITQEMNYIPSFGTYNLDLFNLTPSTPYDVARAYSVSTANTTRNIRLTGFRLSDFGITLSNVGQVKSFKILPSGTSDYAFVSYNANSVNLPPNISQNAANTNTTICSGGTVNLAVVATPSAGGTLSYSWEGSPNGGSSWSPVVEGGANSGTASNKLTVINPTNGYLYRASALETGNGNAGISNNFTVTVSAPLAPTSVSIAGGATVCRNSPVQLTSAVVGGSNLLYQWQSNGVDIADANLSNYVPPVNQTGSYTYRVVVSSGSGCPGAVTSSTATVVVNGISTATPSAICAGGPVPLSATATSGTINWYDLDAGGTLVATGNSFAPTLSASRTYYIAATGTCVGALRVPVMATVYPTSIGGTISGDTTVVTGSNSSPLTLHANTGTIVTWQSSTDGFNTIINDISNTTAQLIVNNLTQTTQFRTVIKSGDCAATFSSPATITVMAVLPIHNNSIKATKENKGILVQWTTYDQQNTQQFEVERSIDGVRFTKISSIPKTNSNSATVNYEWLDMQPVSGNNFYRIKEVYLTAKYAYSTVVKLFIENGRPGILINPNPVTSRRMNLQFNEMSAGTYHINFINNYGQVVNQSALIHAGGSGSFTLQFPPNISTGSYKLQIIGPGKMRSSYTVLVLQQDWFLR